jgi:biotin transport system ATP-binding protein
MPEAAIDLSHITKRFRMDDESPAQSAESPSRTRNGFFYALDEVSLNIPQGECTVIGGANGSGKSLLMGIIAGLDSPSSGTVFVRDRAGIVFQDADSQILGETPREDVSFGPKNLKLPKEDAARIVRDCLSAVGLLPKADFPARFLSGGEKRRLSLAGVLAMNPPVIIFDEPYANLDYAGVKDVNAASGNLKREKRTLLILTHELEKCLALADRFVALCEGKIVFDGTPAQGLEPQNAARLENWGIRYPLVSYTRAQELVWL